MTRGEMEQIIDALEYRVAQLEDRVFREANDTHKRALRRRRQLYYAALEREVVDA